MIDKLPKRSDPIYKEIEGFEDYEFTNCIAYEMYIRTNLFNSIIKEIEIIIEKNSSIFKDINIDRYDNQRNENKLNKIIKEIDKEIYKVNFTTTWGHRSNPFFLNLAIAFSNSYYRSIGIENSQMTESLDNAEHYELDNIEFYRNGEKLHSLQENERFEVNTIFHDFKEKELIANYDQMSLKLIFDRPEFRLVTSPSINIAINLNLPKDELIAYISKIKAEYDNDNSIIKNPLELLGEDLEKATGMKSKALPTDKEKRRAALADAFYIYDVRKILNKDYSIKIDEFKTKRDIEIEAVKKNIYYDKYDRKSQIEEIKRNYEDTYLKHYTPVALKTEIANLLNTSIDKVEKLHALMIKYIDNLKYKELITGITN